MSPGGCEYIDIEELLYFRNCKVRPKRNPEVVNLNSLRKTGTVVFQSFCQKRLCYVQAFSDFIQIAVSGLKRLDKPLNTDIRSNARRRAFSSCCLFQAFV